LISLFFGRKKGIIIEYLMLHNKKKTINRELVSPSIVREGKQ